MRLWKLNRKQIKKNYEAQILNSLIFIGKKKVVGGWNWKKIFN
jgi:hypothetical protein